MAGAGRSCAGVDEVPSGIVFCQSLWQPPRCGNPLGNPEEPSMSFREQDAVSATDGTIFGDTAPTAWVDLASYDNGWYSPGRSRLVSSHFGT